MVGYPENLTDPRDQIDNSCQASNRNEFVVSGRGGIPNAYIQSRNGELFIPDFRRDSSMNLTESSASAIAELSNSEIIQAQSWRKTVDGQIILAANPSQSQQHIAAIAHPNCIANNS